MMCANAKQMYPEQDRPLREAVFSFVFAPLLPRPLSMPGLAGRKTKHREEVSSITAAHLLSMLADKRNDYDFVLL